MLTDTVEGPGETWAPSAGGTDRRAPARTIRRLVAYGVDAVVVAILVFTVVAASSVALGPTVRFAANDGLTTMTVDGGRATINGILGWLVAGGYFIASWTRRGRTPGQRLLGIRVERVEAGTTLGLSAAVVRWLALGGAAAVLAVVVRGFSGAGTVLGLAIAVWSLLLLLSTILGRNGRGLHDGLAGSVVVRDVPSAPATG